MPCADGETCVIDDAGQPEVSQPASAIQNDRANRRSPILNLPQFAGATRPPAALTRPHQVDVPNSGHCEAPPVLLAQTAADGERCASGFCEDEADCPQCARGLACQVGAREPRPHPSFCLHPSVAIRLSCACERCDDTPPGMHSRTAINPRLTVLRVSNHRQALTWTLPSGQVEAGMMCAGTCYGTCGAEVVSLPVEETGPPEGCTSWHDGCNTCGVVDGGVTACTR